LSDLVGDFEGTKTKALIRRNWDLPILEVAAKRLGRPLNYLGLPGPLLEDLRDWKHLLGEITGIEALHTGGADRRSDQERHRRLLVNVLVYGFDRFQLLGGMLEDIILEGRDVYKKRPKLSYLDSHGALRFNYDILNYDFFGGIGYRKQDDKPARIEAIRSTFQRLEGTSFILLLTLNVRDTLGDELTEFLDSYRTSATSDIGAVLSWYSGRSAGERDYKLKAAVPLFVREAAEASMFDVQVLPPISYAGSGPSARMVHFTFELTHRSTVFPLPSRQRVDELISLPMLKADESGIWLAELQHDGFDWAACQCYIAGLPVALRSAILPQPTDRG
jgi:hypothetical protein